MSLWKVTRLIPNDLGAYTGDVRVGDVLCGSVLLTPHVDLHCPLTLYTDGRVIRCDGYWYDDSNEHNGGWVFSDWWAGYVPLRTAVSMWQYIVRHAHTAYADEARDMLSRLGTLEKRLAHAAHSAII